MPKIELLSLQPSLTVLRGLQSRSAPSVATGGGQVFSDVGLYKGVVISIKHIKKEHIQLTRDVLLEFNEVGIVHFVKGKEKPVHDDDKRSQLKGRSAVFTGVAKLFL